jgi:hypothetical protein
MTSLSLQSPSPLGTSHPNANEAPATPELQASSLPLERATTPRPSRKDFRTSSAHSRSTPTSPSQHTLSPLPHRPVTPRSSPPSRAFGNSPTGPIFATTANISTFIATAATGEPSGFDSDSGFSDNAGDVTSPEPGYLEHKYSEYLFPCDDEELLGREPLTHEAISRLRKYDAKPFLGTEHLHLDPFNGNPQKTIDLGAGTCHWADDCS